MHDVEEVVIRIEGMSCGHCVKAVRDALASSGVTVRDVEIGRAVIELRDAESVRAALAAVEEAGYEASVRPGA